MKKLSELSPGARVWIYVSPRLLSADEVKKLREEGEKFIDGWAAHGKKLEASFDVINDIFIVVAADEAMMAASGCSIDTSVHFIQTVGKNIGIDLLNRNTVWYRNDEKLASLPLHEFWSYRKAGKILDETVVFNTLVRNVEELSTRFEVPFHSSWHQEMWQ